MIDISKDNMVKFHGDNWRDKWSTLIAKETDTRVMFPMEHGEKILPMKEQPVVLPQKYRSKRIVNGTLPAAPCVPCKRK